ARTITSELLKIPGVGPAKRRALLHVFGSVQGVRDATLEQVAAVPGFGLASARKLHEALGVPLSPTTPIATPESDTPTDAPAAPTSPLPPVE
ncbi:MAG: helix-hairpin-helix domain-containing protein, partial [Gemmatimonadaceae bacterium]